MYEQPSITQMHVIEKKSKTKKKKNSNHFTNHKCVTCMLCTRLKKVANIIREMFLFPIRNLSIEFHDLMFCVLTFYSYTLHYSIYFLRLCFYWWMWLLSVSILSYLCLFYFMKAFLVIRKQHTFSFSFFSFLPFPIT